MNDEIHCEEQPQISVRGIAYPVTTYRVVDLKANLEAARRAIRAELPHMRLRIEPDLMSPDQRDEAAAALRDALARVTGSNDR